MAGILAEVDFIKYLAAHKLANATTGQPYPFRLNCVAKTAATYQVLATDPNGTVFHTTGAGDVVAFTLPDPAAVVAGTWYLFYGGADFAFSVAAPTADTLVTLNDLTADSVSPDQATQLIGALLFAVCLGAVWACVGIGVGATYTVTTA